VQQGNGGPSVARPLNIFFSYSSDNLPFVAGLLRHTSFRTILRGKIWDYRDRSIKVGELREGLRKSMALCDLFVAFIGRAYAAGATTAFEFDHAIKLVTGGTSQLRDMIFVILDADGAAWWESRKNQRDIKQWREDPVWLDCQNVTGSGPRAFDSDTALVTEFNDLAKQLRDKLQDAEQDPAAGSAELGP
jgi:hypothetical protein